MLPLFRLLPSIPLGIDRGSENRQHGNKPYFTRVSLSFSTGNTAATGGNRLLLFSGFSQRRGTVLARMTLKAEIFKGEMI